MRLNHLRTNQLAKLLVLVISMLILISCFTNPPGSYTENWKGDRKIKHIALDNGFTLRYLQSGKGQPLLLMHTIRTQLDYFQKLIPLLEKNYEIYAIDLPGHGYSSLIETEYTETLMRATVQEFIEKLDLNNVVLVGESIGGVLSLTVAAELPNRISRVVSLNPYDNGEDFGGSIRRSENGWLVASFKLHKGYISPPRFILNSVLKGGFYDNDKLPESLVTEFSNAGKQEGFHLAQYSTFANWKSWLDAKSLYKNIKSPVTLIYGSHDWSRSEERRNTATLIPKSEVFTLKNTGHFSSLENPVQVSNIILADK